MHQHPLRPCKTAHVTPRMALVVLALVALAMAAGASNARSAAASSLPQYLQTYQFVDKFGAPGTADGSFAHPNQITFGPNGHLYEADTGNARIQELTTDGTWVSTIGVLSPPDWGGGDFGFDQPQGVAVSADHVWAVDYTGALAWFAVNGTWQGLSRGPNYPADDFGQPDEAAVDGQGNVYVADGGINHRVDKYDSSGAFVCTIADTALLNPAAVAVDAAGRVYAADSVGGQILRFTPDDLTGTSYSRTATWAPGGLSSPASLALDAAGNIYAGDTGLGKVVKLSPSGRLLAEWGSDGSGDGQFTYLLGVAVDPATGYVYVGDRDAARIQSFRLLDKGPKTYASANVTVKKGKAVTFKYGVAEDVSAKATVSLKIKKGATVKATIKLGLVNCGSWLTKKWTCKLAKGSYRWYVYATDQGGHAQVLLGTKALTVK